MSFDFDYLEYLKHRQIEDDEEQSLDEDSPDEKDEEDEESPTDEVDDDKDIEEEADFYADFIRDIVHPDLNLDDIVAEFELLEEDITNHFLSTDALALEHEPEVQDEEIQFSENTEIEADFNGLATDYSFSEQSIDDLIAEVRDHESELIEHFDQDSLDSLDYNYDLLKENSSDQPADVEVIQGSLTQLLLSPQEDLESQDTVSSVIEDEFEEGLDAEEVEVELVEEVDSENICDQVQATDLSTETKQTDLYDIIEDSSTNLQELIELTDHHEKIGISDIHELQELQGLVEDYPNSSEHYGITDFRDIQDEDNLLDLQTIEELIKEQRELKAVNEHKELEESEQLEELKEIDVADELQTLADSDDLVSIEISDFSLDFTLPELENDISLDDALESLPIFSSVEPINQSDLLNSLVAEQTAIEETLNSPSYQDPEKLSLNELEEFTAKQYELESLHKLIELVPLFSQIDNLHGKDFLVFEDDFLFQEYASTLYDAVNEFSSQSVAFEAPHFLHEIRPDLPSVSHGPYIVEPPPYNYLEELETLYAQSDEAAPRSSPSIVDNFEKAREVQLKSSANLVSNYIQKTSDKEKGSLKFSDINSFIHQFNLTMQNLKNKNMNIPNSVFDSIEKFKETFPDFTPIFRYENKYFFMENYDKMVQEVKPSELITTKVGGAYTKVFNVIDVVRERTFILKNSINDKTYRTMIPGVPKINNKIGFYSLYRKVMNKELLAKLRVENDFSPQQTKKAIYEEINPLNEVEYILLSYLNQQKRMGFISPYLREHIKKEIMERLNGFNSILGYPPTNTYVIKVFNTTEFLKYLVNESKGIFNSELPTNYCRMAEFIETLEDFSSELGLVNLADIVGSSFKNERVIQVADPSERISNDKVLKAYFESCFDAHINAVPRFLFQSPKWIEEIGLGSSQEYTAYNTGNTIGMDQHKVVPSGRQDFTITNQQKITEALAQNKLLRTGLSSTRTTFLTDLSRDMVATQGYDVPGYNVFTLLNNNAIELGIRVSFPRANITYIGVHGGVSNPGSALPKLGQLAEWAMFQAYSGDSQVTSGSHLDKEVKYDSLLEAANLTSLDGSQFTKIPSNSEIDENLVHEVHTLINSTNNPLEFLLGLLRVSIKER